jgi:hypothetical protein
VILESDEENHQEKMLLKRGCGVVDDVSYTKLLSQKSTPPSGRPLSGSFILEIIPRMEKPSIYQPKLTGDALEFLSSLATR